jgi:hypothetical protein
MDIVDSAIKIGLGALIAGSVSLFTLRITQRNEREKEFRAHRIKTIEIIAGHVDEFFNAHLRLISKIAWYADLHGAGATPVTDEMEESIQKPDQELLSASDGLRIAGSRLRLLGADDCVKHLKRAANLVMEFRNQCATDRELPSSARIESHRQEVDLLKEKTYEALHAIYEKF